MESNLSRALILGTGIFISIMIVSAALIGIDQYTKSYQLIEESKIGLLGGFGELEKYNNTELIALDALNATKKYYKDRFISVVYEKQNGAMMSFNNRLSDAEYDSLVETLRVHLAHSEGAMSMCNKKCRATVTLLENPSMGFPEKGKIDSKVEIRFREVS